LRGPGERLPAGPLRRHGGLVSACAAQGQYVQELSAVSAAGFHAGQAVPGGHFRVTRQLKNKKPRWISPAGLFVELCWRVSGLSVLGRPGSVLLSRGLSRRE